MPRADYTACELIWCASMTDLRAAKHWLSSSARRTSVQAARWLQGLGFRGRLVSPTLEPVLQALIRLAAMTLQLRMCRRMTAGATRGLKAILRTCRQAWRTPWMPEAARSPSAMLLLFLD